MPRTFIIALIFFMLVFLAFFIGLIVQQPLLTMSYLCLAPWVGIWVGRASVGMALRARIALVEQR